MYNNSMAKRQPFTRIEAETRRKSLLEATARCLAKRGAAGVSVRAICAEAAVSPGLLRHYFAGVSEAIAETYRWTGARVAAALDEAVAAAGPNHRARLLAYLIASFRPPIATGDLLATAEGTFIAVPEDQLERLKARYGMRRIDGSRSERSDTTDRADL